MIYTYIYTYTHIYIHIYIMYVYIYIYPCVCVCVGARHPMFLRRFFRERCLPGYCTQVTGPRCGFCTPGIVMSLYTTLCRTLFVKGWEKPCDGTMAGVLWRIGQPSDLPVSVVLFLLGVFNNRVLSKVQCFTNYHHSQPNRWTLKSSSGIMVAKP